MSASVAVETAVVEEGSVLSLPAAVEVAAAAELVVLPAERVAQRVWPVRSLKHLKCE